MNNKSVSLLVVIFPLSFFFTLATEQLNAIAQTNTADRYSPKYVREYMENCVKASMTEELPKEEAKICVCTLINFNSNTPSMNFKN